MLIMNETTAHLPISSSVRCYGHVLRREDGHVLRREDGRIMIRKLVTWNVKKRMESRKGNGRSRLMKKGWSEQGRIVGENQIATRLW